MRALSTLLTMALVSTSVSLPDQGFAQPAQSPRGYRIAVVPGAVSGVSQRQGADIVEESAYLAQDFGGFEVVRGYQLEPYVGPELARAVGRCRGASRCYLDALFRSSFDYALVVNITRGDEGVRVVYEMLDVRVGLSALTTETALPAPTDFAYLMVPCHDALKSTPDWVEPSTPLPADALPPVALEPPPVAAARPTPPPLSRPLEATGPRRPVSTGAWVAGAGGAVMAGGLLLGFAADDTLQILQGSPRDRDEVTSLQAQGERQQLLANVALGVGGAALAGGVIMMLLDRDAGGSVTVIPIERGVQVGVRW
jgi:hypothetical protein